jgi:hypothetical protein
MSNGNDKAMVQVPQPGEVVRRGFDSEEIEVRGDVVSIAMAAQARAQVEAAYVMAMRNPRDMDRVRVKLLKATQRRRFAEAGRYLRPVGREKNKQTGRWEEKIAEGLSIRFAEEAARNMGNLHLDSFVVYEDNRKKVVKFVVTDLETNTHWARTRTIEKTKEKKKLWEDEEPIAQRINSQGEVTFIVEATADDVTKREGAEASKAFRDGILKNLPADIKEECLEAIQKTIASEATVDPDGEKKRILDAFASVGVEPDHLKAYLGHELATVSPAELVKLRGIFTSIKEGTTNWGDVMAAKQDADDANASDAKRAAAAAPPAAQPQPQPGPAAATSAQPAQPAPAAGGGLQAGKVQQNLSDVAAKARTSREAKQPGEKTPAPAPKERETGEEG